MLRILVLTRLRPDDRSGGGALRCTQNIHALSALGSVDVVSVGVDGASEPIDGIREWTPVPLPSRAVWGRLRSRAWPLRPGAYPSVECGDCSSISRWFRRRLAERRYDVAVIENITLVPWLRDLRRAGCRIVFDAHNVETMLHAAVVAARSGPRAALVRRLKDRLVQQRLAAVEQRIVREADVLWACSELDAVELARRYRPAAPITVVPNGVDVDAYRPPDVPNTVTDWSGCPITLLYPGQFAYAPNEDAARSLIERVLPAVRAFGRPARLLLVGRDPTPAMRQAAARQPGVEVTGEVESVLPYLQRPCAVVLPIRLGSGTRLKIVEAFAAGRPVVTTAKGAEGLEARDGEHLFIREDPKAMAAAVVQLWTSPLLREALCASALGLVRRRYSWQAAAHCIASSLGVEPGGSSRGDEVPCRHFRVAPRAGRAG